MNSAWTRVMLTAILLPNGRSLLGFISEMDSDDDFIGYSDDSDHFSSEDDTFGNDPTFEDQIAAKILKNYTVLSTSDIRRRQADAVAAVSSVLDISASAACILLFHHRWSPSTVHEAWFSDEEKTRKTTGLLLTSPESKTNKENQFICGICFESYPIDDSGSAFCGHLFCKLCLGQYIGTSIEGGPGCLTLRCPEPSCIMAIGQDMVNNLASDTNKIKYDNYLIRSYVEGNRNTKWCPAPGCDYAIEFDSAMSGGYDVACLCGHLFCWNCTEEAHRPVDCDTVAKWILKNSAEAENVTWILAYTKPCPKCKRPIEKNKGCMHMTCNSACKFQFCWLCLGDWTTHAVHSRCNRYSEDNSGENSENDTERRRKMARKSIERYTHYYERWAANHSSRVKALSDLRNLEAVKLEKLSKKQDLPVTDLKFVTEALVQVIECRRVLKWSYAYGYYLSENDENGKKIFFEYLQSEAEDGLERLHNCAEKELGEYLEAKTYDEKMALGDFGVFRTKLTGLTSVTKTYFENLVKALENGLSDVDSCVGGSSSGKTKEDVGSCVGGSSSSKTKEDGKKKKRVRGKLQIKDPRSKKRQA